jgi:hypothetical protein
VVVVLAARQERGLENQKDRQRMGAWLPEMWSLKMDWRKAEDFLVDSLRRQGLKPYHGSNGDKMVGIDDDDGNGGNVNITLLAKELSDSFAEIGV